MRISNIVYFPLVVSLCFTPVVSGVQLRPTSFEPSPVSYRDWKPDETSIKDLFLTPVDNGGIKEVIAAKYTRRYQEWKTEFLSTSMGRAEWDSYGHNGRFVLTITVSEENSRGAGTSRYKWNDAGELVAATITLGGRISEGYPNPVYYPVMNSLAPGNSSFSASGSILAATKIAHEFGHLDRMAKTNAAVYHLQSQLIPVYNSILLSNGRNVRDPRLIELAQRMGGTPVELWEDREYWGEVKAMVFLRDKIAKQGYQCSLFNKIREFVDTYAKAYRQRFAEVAESTPASYDCSW
jgi:YD repeat-containing protein